MKISDFEKKYCIQIENAEQKKIVFDYLTSKDMNYIKNYIFSKGCDESPFPYYVYFGYDEGILYPIITNVKPTVYFRTVINFSEVVFI